MKKYAIVILAAGQASRMGEPKQLLRLGEKTIIENIIEEAIASEKGDVFVVLGAYQKEILKVISTYPIEIIFNENFKTGMGSSIACGIKKIKGYGGVLILLADQIFTTRKVISDIFQIHENSNSSIVKSDYENGSGGAPAFFEKKYFNDLKNLKGDEGAKKIVKRYKNEVANFPFPKGAFDIDTRSDFEKLLKFKNS